MILGWLRLVAVTALRRGPRPSTKAVQLLTAQVIDLGGTEFLQSAKGSSCSLTHLGLQVSLFPSSLYLLLLPPVLALLTSFHLMAALYS